MPTTVRPHDVLTPRRAAAPDARSSRSELEERFTRLEASRIERPWRELAWRAVGRVGHALLRRRPPLHVHASGRRLLNLGAGARLLDGWVNADFFRPWRRRGRPDWSLDMTRRFRCEDAVFDGALLEHVLEHFSYSEATHVLGEVRRVLRPGGVVRIALPSLEAFLAWDEARLAEPKMARFASQAEAVSFLAQNHGHRSVWSAALLFELLAALGFEDARRVAFREATHPEMAVDAEGHRWESLYVEARAPSGGHA